MGDDSLDDNDDIVIVVVIFFFFGILLVSVSSFSVVVQGTFQIHNPPSQSPLAILILFLLSDNRETLLIEEK